MLEVPPKSLIDNKVSKLNDKHTLSAVVELMSTQVSAALCQKTPTVLSSLKHTVQTRPMKGDESQNRKQEARMASNRSPETP